MPFRSLVAALVFFCCALPVASAQQYTYTNITYPGATDTYASKINDASQVAGYDLGTPRPDGFLYNDGIFHNINFPLAGTTTATGINNLNQVVGYYTGGNCSATRSVCGFIKTVGGYEQIMFPGSINSSMQAINDSGLAIGTFIDETGIRSFLWQSGSVTGINVPDATDTQARGINNLGEVVGYWATPSEQGDFLYSNGHFSRLTGPGGTFALIDGINDYGDFVGTYSTSSGGPHGFVNIAGVYTTLDYPGAISTFATGINNAGEIVGYYKAPGCVEICSFLATPTANAEALPAGSSRKTPSR